jgi:hypothetical protein
MGRREQPQYKEQNMSPKSPSGLMHQWQATQWDVTSLEKAQVPIPEPDADQILVKVGAAVSLGTN